MNNTIQESTIVQEFRAFEKENGPSYIYGHITAPYDGCFYLHACAIVRGDFAFVTADLSSFRGDHRGIDYAQYVIPAYDQPDDLYFLGNQVGCVRLSDIEKVLSEPSYHSGLEFHPLSGLAPNVPNALVGQVLEMCQDLGYAAIVEGKFCCALCECDLLFAEGVEYLESEFKGNGGVGIDVGAPVCSECYSLHHCPWCGSEVEPDFQEIDEKGHCIYCAPKSECVRCGEKIDLRLSWNASQDDIDGYRTGHCGECHNLDKIAEIENTRYAEIAAATASLF